jgi:hypothetical protein
MKIEREWLVLEMLKTKKEEGKTSFAKLVETNVKDDMKVRVREEREGERKRPISLQ